MKKHHDLDNGITYAAIDIYNLVDAPELRASYFGKADGLTVTELSPSDLTDSERKAFGFPVEGGES